MYDEGSVVECSDKFLEPAQGLSDVNVHLHDQVDASPLEQRVLLLVQHNDYVARFKSGLLQKR